MSNHEVVEEYSAYVSLVNTAITMTLSLLSLWYSSRVLFIKAFRTESQNLSPVITVYFGFLSIWCLTNIIDSIHLLIFWRPNILIYNGTELYLFGIFPWFCLYVNPMVDLFLCIDRCFAILLPLQYTKRGKSIMTFAMIVSLAVLIVIGFDIRLLIAMASDAEIEKCQSFSCAILFYRNLYSMPIKLAITASNLLAGIFLASLLRFYRKLQNKKIRKASRTVIIIVGATVIFDVLPTIMALCFLDFTLLTIKYLGTYAATLTAINVCLCSTIYSRTIRKSCNEASLNSRQKATTRIQCR